MDMREKGGLKFLNMWSLYASDDLQNCTLETCMILLTNVTPINLI